MQVDPLLVLVMAGLGYIAYGFLSPTLNPFAKSRRGARRRHIRFAQLVGSFLALSWVVTLFVPMPVLLANLPTRLGMSLLAALVPIGVLCAMVMLSAWRESRAAEKQQREDDFEDELRESEPADTIILPASDAFGRAPLYDEPDVSLELDLIDETEVQVLEAGLDEPEPLLSKAADMPFEEAEQVGRVSELVDNYELDESPGDDLDATSMIHGEDVDLPEKAFQAAQRPLSAVDAVQSANALATTPSGSDKQIQLAELATSNLKLKKLVIAQQAVIDSEKKSHDRTRAIARRAVQAAREAIEGRKSAEKMARRETAERQRANLKAKEATAALQNALSVLRKEQGARRTEQT